MSPEQQALLYSEFVLCLKEEFPDFEFRYKKDVWWMKAINFILVIITLGRFTSFMEHFITTIGNKVYISGTWDKMSSASKYVVLRHERTHMRQSRLYGRFVYSFLYLFGYLPAGWCVWRTRFEREAYEETTKAAAFVYGSEYVKTPEFREKMLHYFLGPDYLWMCPAPKSMNAWFDKVLEKI